MGGGITGLVAAHRLLSDPQPPRFVVYESASELGGRSIQHTRVVATSSWAQTEPPTAASQLLPLRPAKLNYTYEQMFAAVLHVQTDQGAYWSEPRSRNGSGVASSRCGGVTASRLSCGCSAPARLSQGAITAVNSWRSTGLLM